MDCLDQGKKARSSSLQAIITSWSLPNTAETRKTTETIECTYHQQVEARMHPNLRDIYLSDLVEDDYNSCQRRQMMKHCHLPSGLYVEASEPELESTTVCLYHRNCCSN
jgi:hypothetical protein